MRETEGERVAVVKRGVDKAVDMNRGGGRGLSPESALFILFFPSFMDVELLYRLPLPLWETTN